MVAGSRNDVATNRLAKPVASEGDDVGPERGAETRGLGTDMTVPVAGVSGADTEREETYPMIPTVMPRSSRT